MTASRLLAVAGAVLALAAPAVAQPTYTWQPTTSGNWNVAANWLDQGSVPGVPVGGTTTALAFNASGTQSYTATNDIGAFTLNRLTVNNTGTGTVTIAGAAANTLTLAGIDPTLDITGRVLFTGLFAGGGTIIKAGTGTFIHDSNNGGFTGTLVVNGGTFINRDNANVSTNFNPVSIVVNSGGTYQFGDATIGNPNLPNSTYITLNAGGTVVWDEGEDFGGVDLNGGTLNLRAGGYNAQGTRAQAWTSGTVTGSQAASGTGTASTINKTTAGVVTVTGGASLTGSGPLNIQEGTVAHVNAANLGTKAVALGNAAGTTAGAFEYQGLTASRGGTFTVNAGGGTIGVTNAGTTLTLTGGFSGGGNLTKAGAGTLALTGALGGTGTTTVAAGTLQVNPVAAAGGFAVSNGGTLAVTAGTGSAAFATPTLALGDATSVVRFDLNTASLPTSPLLTVTNFDGLTTAGATLALNNQQPFATGTYTLIGYTGTQLSSGFALSLPGRTVGSLDYSAAGQINAVITGTDTVKWGGQVNGTWDVGTAPGVGGTNNWRLTSNDAATNFIQTDTVTFDDTAAGNFTVAIGATVNPSSVAVNNSANDYTFAGAGGIGGTATLTKSGTGRLTVATANSYTGGTTVTAGVVQVGNGGTTGDLGTGAVTLAGGGLEFGRSDAYTFANAVTVSASGSSLRNVGAGAVTVSSAIALGANAFGIGGAGDTAFGGAISGTGAATITKTGAGTVFLDAANTGFTGTLQIDAGRVILRDAGGSGDINATSIVVNSGGVFQFGAGGITGENPDLPDATYITVNAGGEAIFRVGEQFGGVNLLGGTLTLNGGGAGGLVGATAMDWRSGTVNGLTANGTSGANTITKTTAGTVFVTGLATIGNVLNIQEGTVSFATAANLGSAAIGLGGTSTNGTVEYLGATATRGGAFTLNSGGGTVRVAADGTTLTLSGVVSGVGGLTKVGAGTLALSGTNTYAGATTVTAGTLLVNGNSASAVGAVTVATGATLGGTGTVGGTTAVQAGGTIRGASGTGTGTLNTGSVTLTGGSGTSGATLATQLATDAGGTVTANSQLAVGVNTFNLDVTGGRVNIALLNDGGLTQGGTYTVTLVNGSGGFGNFLRNGSEAVGGNAYTAADVNLVSGSGTWTFQDVGLTVDGFNNLVLTFTPVPEPVTVLAVGAAGLGLFGWVRRKRAK